MSRGTTFKLLKKSRVKLEPGAGAKLAKNYEERGKVNEQFFVNDRRPRNAPKYPKFIDSCDPAYDYVDTEANVPYNKALEVTFNSVFGDMREILINEYGMNPYDPWFSEMEVKETMAREMLIAVNYLLLEHYDKKIEEVMDNPFIDPLGTLSEKYNEWKYKQMFPDADDYTPEEDNSDALKRLRTILSAFLEEKYDSNYYILVVEVWG